MAEDMTFLPKTEILTLEELDRLCSAFVDVGVRKLRLTGGEPLVRKNVMSLIRNLGRHLDSGALDELTLTTNGSQLSRFASELRDIGIRRINVSLDTLDPDLFAKITRWGRLEQVMEGLRAAQASIRPPSADQSTGYRWPDGSARGDNAPGTRGSPSATTVLRRRSCDPNTFP